ncbi:hypothetical protein B0A48_00025 [Cryoendolithus antarcticus]|uniref:Heterokaryon incompatibility domain-containing protein n=1 Tax=Cryoendolithus antarcticus TaxID=1507870 RepID=A0A1V8TTI2_9PEZI|nr:hypothetical protein B0A48_00025 [Cryoendolithus antarcticus]
MSKAFFRDKAWRPLRESGEDVASIYTVDPRLAWVYEKPVLSPSEDTFDSASGEAYDYDGDNVKLKEGEKCLRLLQVLAGDFEEAIECTLSAYKLAVCPPYEALSYCWGDTADPVTIKIDGKVMKVTSNLRAALRHLRSRASEVPKAQDNAPLKTSEMLSYMLPSQTEGGTTKETNSSLPEDSRALEALRDAIDPITNRPWFWRVWVVQEVALARTAIIVCGSDILSWTVYTTGIEFATKIGVLESSIMGALRDPHETYANMIAPSEFIIKTERPADLLLSLLHKCRFREATNAADKVYSMLGLVGKNIAELGIVPDYTVSSQQIFRDVARSILVHGSSLDLVGMAESMESFPSWIPDWTRPAQATPFAIEKASTSLLPYASLRTAPELRISGQGDVLILKGHTIDRIVEIAGHMDPMQDWFDDMDNRLSQYDEPFSRLAEPGEDAPLLQESKIFLQEIPGAFKWIGGALHLMFHELFRTLEPLERFVEWEKLAKIHGKGPASVKAANMSAYLEVLTAGNNLPGGPEATRRVFEDWLGTLSPVRNLLLVKSATTTLYKSLAFAVYLRKTWQSFGEFSDVLDHVYNRQAGDLIVVCKGGRVPLCLRPADQVTFTLMGEAYVHGVMNGEAFDEELCEPIPIR